ncbi:MAG: bifunctional histidinol-phosphatase/imidazoleglycerol-phosphate dehydratase HisB [Bacteroidota bacterium]
MRKVLFIDRDGTLVKEPTDYQVDALEKVEFYPQVFQYLARIVQEFDYELVMVTNQDGLGTDSFPEVDFWPAHNHILQSFENEGIDFREVIIDRTFAKDQAPTRKPGTALLRHYLKGGYDLENSIVIGDRLSDIQLAKNLGAKGIWLDTDPNLGATESNGLAALKNTIALRTQSWKAIYQFLQQQNRTAQLKRYTRETKIDILLNLDGAGQAQINTGLPFFDHMLDQIARHSGCDVQLQVVGDLEVDEHHTVEDTALALGQAFREALGKKVGIERYGFSLPMDEAKAEVLLDFGGRPGFVWEVDFKRERVGEIPTELFAHFFKSFSDAAACNLHVRATADNEHHLIESIFKAFARAIRQAIYRVQGNTVLPSTKGTL